MKRTLLILRHAKSSWSDAGIPDRVRPLSKRGQLDAPEMGKRLKKSDYSCDLLISSPAVRALKTAKAVAKELAYKSEIMIDECLYMADISDYLAVMAKVDKNVQHLMIVSHNPGSEELVKHLTSKAFDRFPTGAYALIEIDGSWSKVKSAKLIRFDYPKSVQS